MTPDCECWIEMFGDRLTAGEETCPPPDTWGIVPYAAIAADDALCLTGLAPAWLAEVALRERHAKCAERHGRVREAQDWLDEARRLFEEAMR